MQQTLLAIVALLATMTYWLSFTQKQIHLQRQEIWREMEEMGTGLGLEVIEIARSRPFDGCVNSQGGPCADVPGDFAYSNNTDHFTDNALNVCAFFEPAQATGTNTHTCDDLDDFHGQSILRQYVMERANPADNDTLWFQIDLEVEYVKQVAGEWVREDARTTAKRIRAYVQDVWPGSSRSPYIPEPMPLPPRVIHYNGSAETPWS